jgi:hypothetical protein
MSLGVQGSSTGVANLVALVNYSNPTSVQITEAQVTFSDLITNYTNVGGFQRNTQVRIAAVDGAGFINGPAAENGFNLQLARVGLDTGVTVFTDEFNITVDTTWDQLKTQIANANNIVIGDYIITEQGVSLGSDKISVAFPPPDGSEGNTQAFTIIPIGSDVAGTWVSSSYVYNTGSVVAITGLWEATDAPLDTVIINTDLNGFVPAS